MSGNNKGKKPKIFVKKRPDKIDAVHDEFYEYDNLKSKNNTLDESFFEDFKSVDFDQMNYDKEHVPSEDIGDEYVPSADIIEDEVIQEIPEKTVDAGENTDKIVEDKTDKIVEDVSTSEQFDSDDDDFGSLESENEDFILKEEPKAVLSDEKSKDEAIAFEDKDEKDSIFDQYGISNDEDFILKEEPKAVLSDEKSKDEAIAFEDKDEKDSIFDQYGISNDEELAKEENYDSLFEKDESTHNELEDDDEDDDDDFGSLDDEIKTGQINYINVSQKPNYYNELKDTTDELEDDEDDDEYYIDRKGRKKKRRKGIRIFFKFLLAFLLACMAIMVYFGLTHDLFKIDYINVVGNVANEREILISKSGVSVGDNIFLASSSKIKKNLKELSNIEDVKVRKNYPNIIEIEVKENYVSAYINTASGLTTIDNYGKVKEVATDNSKASGAQLKGISETGLKVGEDFSKDETKVKFLLNILTKEYYSDIVSIDFTNDKEIIIELKNSLKVTFGDLNDYTKKTQIIGILIKKIQLEGINAKEIILNVGDNPIIVKK